MRIVIRLEPGSYAPRFQWRDPEVTQPGAAAVLTPGPVAQPAANDPCAAFIQEAMAALTHGTIERGILARQMFERAVLRWPERPEPHAGLSLFFLLAGFNLIAAKAALFAQAHESAQRALQLNPECALAHGVLGSLGIVVDYDFANANHHLLLAVRTEPGNRILRNLRCNLWLMPLGFLSSAQEEIIHSGENMTDPGGLGGLFGRAQVLYLQRSHKEAIAVVRRLLERNTSFAPATALLAFACHAAGEYEALAQLHADPALIPYPLLRLWIGGCLALAADDRQKAREIVRQMEAEALPQLTEPVLVANLFARLQEHDRAFAWLEHAFETRALRLLYAETDPLFDQLRNDERFPTLTSRMHLHSRKS